MIVRTVHVETEAGKELINALRNRFSFADNDCRNAVTEILARVRQEGDAAVAAYGARFDAPGMTIEKCGSRKMNSPGPRPGRMTTSAGP